MTFTPRKLRKFSRSYVNRANKNSKTVGSGGPKRVRTGFYYDHKRVENGNTYIQKFPIYRDIVESCSYSRIKLDPINFDNKDDPDTIYTRSPFLDERESILLYVVMPSGIFKLNPSSSTTPSSFYYIINGVKTTVESVSRNEEVKGDISIKA